MNSLSRVSAIVPTYNCAPILRGCLDSLVAQDYPNLEIVVMDGGSKDETIDVAQSYGDRIAKIVSEKDAGIYDAMNKGITASSGEWLYFIGADDSLVDPEVISDMMASEAAGDDTTLLLYGNVCGPLTGPKYRGEAELPSVVYHNVCHQAAFYRRRLFDLEAPYNLRYRIYADWDLNLRIYLRHPGTHRYVDRLVANFTGGVSSTQNDEAFRSDLERNVWAYANDCQVPGQAREVRARLYQRDIRTARDRKDWSKTARLLLDAARRSAYPQLVARKALRKIGLGRNAVL